jgi:hypothetical protein
LVPPQNLDLPLPGVLEGQFPHIYSGVAIDGGTLLASAQRAINAQYDRVIGVYIFERTPRQVGLRWSSYRTIASEQWQSPWR